MTLQVGDESSHNRCRCLMCRLTLLESSSIGGNDESA